MSIFQKYPMAKLLLKLLIFSFIILMVALFSKVLIYFNSGADRNNLLNIGKEFYQEHLPNVNWEQSADFVGVELNEYQEEIITRDYLLAWHLLNSSIKESSTDQLKAYFTDTLCLQIKNQQALNTSYAIEQVDLNHDIEIHLYSYDKQVISFTDRCVVIHKKAYDETGQLIYQIETVNDFQVIMILEDGRWKISHLLRKESENCIRPKTERTPFVQMSEEGFIDQGMPYQVSGFNYYPKDFPWSDFWNNYHDSIVAEDLSILKDLGMNSLRIFIPYQDFGAENPLEERMKKLEQLLDLAESYEVKIIVTLFDFPASYHYDHWTRCEKHLKIILERFKDHQAILAWDLKNEIDLDYNSYTKTTVNEWLSYMLKRAKIYDPNHLFTVGWSNPEDAVQFSEELDFISFHYYRKVSEFPEDLSLLQSQVPNKHILLGEFGCSTYSSWIFPINGSPYKQAKYYEQIFSDIDAEGISYLGWTLHDFSSIPSNIFGIKPWIKNTQRHFGIIDSEGKNKAAFDLFKDRSFSAQKSWNDYVPPYVLSFLMLLVISFLILKYFFRFK